MHLFSREDINRKGYELLLLLEISIKPNISNNSNERDILKKFKGIDEIVSIKSDEIINFKTKTTDWSGNNISIHSNIGIQTVGFTGRSYLLLKELSIELLNVDYISKYVDFEYIENEIFKWIINSYKQMRVSIELSDYKLKSIENDIKDFIFYFKMTSLGMILHLVLDT